MNEQAYKCLMDGDNYLPEPVARLARVICGSGNTTAAYGWIFERLLRDTNEDWALMSLEPDNGAEWLSLYLLARLDLTEHGSTVRCSWPTEDGLVLLGFLARWGSAWMDGGQMWVDEEGLSYGFPT